MWLLEILLCHLRYVIVLLRALVYPAGKLRAGLMVSRGPSSLKRRILENRWHCPVVLSVLWVEKGLWAPSADLPSVLPCLSPASSDTGCVCLLGRGSPRVEEPTAGVSNHGGSPARPEAGEFSALMVPRLTLAPAAYPYWHQMISPTSHSLHCPPYQSINS